MLGKAIINIIAIKSQPRKGNAERYMSSIAVPGGATPFITNRLRPNGGVVVAISELRRKSTANQTGSNPKAYTTGINKGMVISIMETTVTNVPMNSKTSCMAIKIRMGDKGRAKGLEARASENSHSFRDR